nr:hypothetical protein [Leifsonia psychrotolerans]
MNVDDSDARAEEERLRLGRLAVRSRLIGLSRAGGGTGTLPVRIVLVSGETILVRPATFGRDWLAGDVVSADTGMTEHRSQSALAMCVLPFAAIAGVVMTPEQIPDSLASEADSAARLIDRIGLPFVLRDLCRRRKTVVVHMPRGALTGTIDRVGRDHLDVAVHPADSPRRAHAVTEYRIVPLAQIQLVLLR